MRISDWSSDVCSSDLAITKPGAAQQRPQRRFGVGSLAVSRGALAIDDRRIDQKRYATLHAEVAQRPVERLRRYAVTCDMFERQRRVARKHQAADRRTTQQKFTQIACKNPNVPSPSPCSAGFLSHCCC